MTLTLLFGAAATVKTTQASAPQIAGEAAFGAAGDADDDDGEYKLSSLRILNRAVLHIKEQYVDPKRVHPREMLLAGLDAVEKQVAEVLVDETGAPDNVTVMVGAESKTFDIKGVDSLWEMSFKLRDIFRFVEPRLPQDQDKRDVEYTTINGMLSTLDPHSVLLPPTMFEEMKMSTQGEFGGLGIVIGLREGNLTVISPMDGTPASRAGLEAKDTITKIGDESTVNMALDEAVKRLRGKPGTNVTIWVLRKGWTEPRKYVITRDVIKIINVTHKLLTDNVGYVKVKQFQQDTATDVKEAIVKMSGDAGGKPLAGMILDLRNNPGGLLEQAVDLSDLFLDTGTIVVTVGEGDRMREEKTARWAGTERDIPVVILVNGGSASASEIVAGALKNNDRALVVGSTTFGKGSVQTLLNFKDNSALKLTIAQYLTPGDVSIQSVGIVPDVELAPMTIGKEAVDLMPDAAGTREKDLEKHLDDARVQNAVKSALTVRHLEEAPKDEDEETAKDVSDKFKSDYEIDFARNLLTRAGSTGKTRQGLLKSAETAAQGMVTEQEAALTNALRPLNVDWSPMPPMEQSGKAHVTARVVGTPTATAGEQFEMRIEAVNEGPATVYRLRANTESDNNLFQDREFLFGKLAPGEKKEWSVKVKVPKDSPSRSDDVKVVFQEAADRVPAPLTVRSQLKELPRPTFRYTAFLDDEKGNGDGQLNPGESADLVLTVTNDGPGIAEEPLVLLKNMGGRELFIREGRAKLEKLAPGQSVTTKVSFDAQSDVKRQVEMRLTVLDSALAEYVSEKLVFPVVDPRGSAAKSQRGSAVVNADASLLSFAGSGAPVVGKVKKGVKLPIERIVGEYARVELGDHRFAFIPVSQVKLGNAKDAPKPSLANISLTAMHHAPDVKVNQPQLGVATAKDSIMLNATVSDPRGLRDAFVFANDQKVFYRALNASKDAHNDNATFDATVPLKKGTNVVTVVVRVDNEVSARRTIVVHREGETDTATAARQEPPSSVRQR